LLVHAGVLGRGLRHVHGFRHYEVRLRRSRRRRYVVARRALVSAAILVPLLLALYVIQTH